MPALWSLFMLPMLVNFEFDFRRDLDRMALLKSLPISDRALAMGQLLPATLLLTLCQLVAVTIAFVSGNSSAELLLAALLVFPPLNYSIAAIDNVIFLLMPYRPRTRDPGRFPFLGRLMVVQFLRMMLMTVLTGVGALAAFLTWIGLGQSALLSGAVGAALLVVAAWGLTHTVAAAFRSLDVTRDVPG
jgi:hypothetical protein